MIEDSFLSSNKFKRVNVDANDSTIFVKFNYNCKRESSFTKFISVITATITPTFSNFECIIDINLKNLKTTREKTFIYLEKYTTLKSIFLFP